MLSLSIRHLTRSGRISASLLTSLFLFPCRAIPFHETYYNVVEGLEEAISHAGNGGDCSVYQW